MLPQRSMSRRDRVAYGRWVSGGIDFYDDPQAPPATRVVLAADVVVENSAGEILLVRRGDDDTWVLPGGAMRLGESLPAAAVRETRAATGVEVEITGLVGIYTDPGHVTAYDDEVRQECSVVFTARAVGGAPRAGAEPPEVRWFAGGLGALRMDRSVRTRIDHFLAEGERPHLG
jgi:ADP-ribose pyrophosphatase YjhB (NUDIX family)